MGRLDRLDLSLSLSKKESFWPALPGLGGMTVFDRSWYGRVLVERVEEPATREQWERAFSTIVGFEWTFCDEGRTEHSQAPWHLIEGDSKRYAGVKVIETVNAEVERGMRERGFPVPP